MLNKKSGLYQRIRIKHLLRLRFLQTSKSEVNGVGKFGGSQYRSRHMLLQQFCIMVHIPVNEQSKWPCQRSLSTSTKQLQLNWPKFWETQPRPPGNASSVCKTWRREAILFLQLGLSTLAKMAVMLQWSYLKFTWIYIFPQLHCDCVGCCFVDGCSSLLVLVTMHTCIPLEHFKSLEILNIYNSIKLQSHMKVQAKFKHFPS